MNNKGQIWSILGFFAIVILIILGGWYLVHFSMGWDTGVMTGKIIGYDTNMFGTKSVFILEDRSVFNAEGRMSQSQITLCSDFDDYEIHKLIEKYLNQNVKVEYMERRVGYTSWNYCLEAPITNISLIEENRGRR